MKKTNEQKQLEGTARPDRVAPADDLKILDKLPSPGKLLNVSLTDRGTKLYRHFGKLLVDTNKLTALDLPNLVQLAVAWDKFLWAEEAMAAKNNEEMGAGYMQTFKSGATNITTEFSISEKAQDQILKIGKLFGFSFKDRHGMLGFFSESDAAQLDIFSMINGQQTVASNPNLKVVGE